MDFQKKRKNRITVRELAIFGVLAGMIFASKKLMEGLPNIHLVGVLLTVITLVYRQKALYPLYTYVLLEGVFGGFSAWWIPYLYIWTFLWGAVMLLPKRIPPKGKTIVYALVCGLHGLAYGTLYAPAQALLYGFTFQRMLIWIAAGFPYDCIHGASNFVLGLILIVPLEKLLRRLSL